MSLLENRAWYKPFMYPWSYEAWKMTQFSHWMPDEVSVGDDVRQWKQDLTKAEKNLITQIFRFFTQADVEVHNCYIEHYYTVFKHPEISMMLSAFANMETIHIAAYAYLLDTIGMPEVEYQAFMSYKQMKDKYDYMQQFNCKDKKSIAMCLAVFGAFTEGLQLFASFAILLNFQRFNKMKGMCQIVAWSVRDETLHTESITRLFRVFISENPEIWTKELQDDLYEACQRIVSYEDAFIALAFNMGDIEGISAAEVELYIRYIGNRRLAALGLHPLYNVPENPLPWLDEIMSGVEHVNFFENTVTDYTKNATGGTWEEVFAEKSENG